MYVVSKILETTTAIFYFNIHGRFCNIYGQDFIYFMGEGLHKILNLLKETVKYLYENLDLKKEEL